MESLTQLGYRPESRFLPPQSGRQVERLVYLLTTATGQILSGMWGNCPLLTATPLVAVDAGMAWLALPVAFEQLAVARRLWPQLSLGLGQLRMARNSSFANWDAVEWRVLGGGQ